VCGKAPTSTGFVTPSGASSKRYAIQNIYQQLKAGCRSHVQAISVDVAGNKSSPTSIRVVAGPSLETTRPVCGTTWCASSGWNAATPWASYANNGYWQVRGPCCTGAGCTPGKTNPADVAGSISTNDP
ncbi:MAG: hypothetical protein AB7O96_15055, partial [Pseudobdellovibrionaceae bacterium]